MDNYDVTEDCGVSSQLELRLDEFFEKCGGSMVDAKGHSILSDCECTLSSFRGGVASR